MEVPPAPLRVDPTFEDEFPGTSAVATECVINLLRTSDLLVGEMTRWLRPHQLSPTAALVVAVVEGAGGALTPNEIGERLLITSGTMTTVIDTLERRGYVRRVPHPSDRRKVLIEITESARSFLDRTMPQIHAMEREWVALLESEEQAHLVELLGKVQARLYALRGLPFPEGGRRVHQRERDGAGTPADPGRG
jgi:DNA-binding MarR family transcriptional regulator